MTKFSYEIVQLDLAEATVHLSELADILADAVEGGASVSFMPPFTHVEALDYWRSILPAVAVGRTILLAALSEGRAVGTVQLVLATPPNQPHRADVAKLLVHSKARRHGIARALLQHLEKVALDYGRRLLTLDTMTGNHAEQLYLSLGYVRFGIIPEYAYFPDGTLGSTSFFYKQI